MATLRRVTFSTMYFHHGELCHYRLRATEPMGMDF